MCHSEAQPKNLVSMTAEKDEMLRFALSMTSAAWENYDRISSQGSVNL